MSTVTGNYPDEIQITVKHLNESLKHAASVFTAISEAIEKGTYTREEAEADLENLTMNEGIDVYSTLESLVHAECDTW